MSDKKHSFVPIENIMTIMARIQNAWHMDIVRNSICKATKISYTFTQLNNQHTVVHKPVFGIITKSAEKLAPEHSTKSWQINVSRDPATSASTYLELGSRFISSGSPSCWTVCWKYTRTLSFPDHTVIAAIHNATVPIYPQQTLDLKLPPHLYSTFCSWHSYLIS